jgi:predicted CXXCH cytochrome family protein
MIVHGRKGWRVLLLGLLMVTSAASAASAQSCATTECHAELAELTNVHAPLEEGECESCHQQVQEQHPATEGVSFELVEPGAKLCYQCHDSYSRNLEIHAPVRGGQCTACHNPHGSKTGKFLLGVDHDLTSVCASCHEGEAFSGEFKHGPSASGACSECHDPHGANSAALLKQPLQENCFRCHSDMAEGMENSPYIHSAVEEENCTGCHNPHSSPAIGLLQKDLESLCMDCHKRVGRNAKNARVKHAALYRDEKCSACHSTHYSQHSSLLIDEEQNVCLSCHGQDDFSKSDPLSNIAREMRGKEFLHGPLEDGQCSSCHNPHGSDNFRLLTGRYPDSFYQPYTTGSYDFCLQCHDKNLLRFEETSIYTEFRNGKQNLHFVHVANKYKGRSCRACHEPHAANSEKLMNAEGAEFGNWRVPTRFVKTETGGSCSPGCHKTYDYDREEPVIYQE